MGAIVAGSLAGVFLFSGATKVLDPEITASALVRFGIVKFADARLARVVGAAEVTLAASLLLVQSVVPLVVSALALAGFTAIQAVALLQGRRFPCGCFGEESDLSIVSVLTTAGFCLTAGWASVEFRATGPDPATVLSAWLTVTAWLLAARAISAVSQFRLLE